MPLADSTQMVHVHGRFYRNGKGHLFQLVTGGFEVKGSDTLVDSSYFNGHIPQDIDAASFMELDGWFAKDKNYAYYYKPVYGGMLIAKIAGADAASFKVLEGHYRYAADNKHVYEATEMVQGLDPQQLRVVKDTSGRIIKLVSGKQQHTVGL